MVTVHEVANRGLNFFATATLAILSTSIAHELRIQAGWPARADDVALGAIALAAVGWYRRGRNRYTRSFAPLGFLLLAVVTEALGAWWQRGGPDAGLAAFFALAAVVFAWQRYASRAPESAPPARHRRPTET